MKYNIVLLLILTVVVGISSFVWQNPISVLEKIDANMSSVNRVVESEMTIYGKRTTRVITSKTWSEGRKSYTEYLSPASDRGTKMLKLDNQLWIYSPATDRVIQISGNMLRQSVMGSDLSYEDMMDSRTLHEMYSEQIIASEQINERDVIVLLLSAKSSDVAYHSQKMWVDAQRMVPLKQELYGKSGQLLKQIEFSDVKQVQGKWFPHTMLYRDMLSDGKGTKFHITAIQFNQVIPPHFFTKAMLKK